MIEETTKTVVDFSFEDMGIDHAQYFTGVSVIYTSWDEVFMGVGDTAREAAEDAYTNCTQSEYTTTPKMAEMATALDTMDDTESAHADCDQDSVDDDGSAPEDFCELHHYVALYVRYAETSEDDGGESDPLEVDFPVSN